MNLYTVRPISTWPHPTRRAPAAQMRSPFKSHWSRTLEDLERELRQLAARDVVLEIDVTEGMIRLDGELYANARPASSAVVLSFRSVTLEADLRYPCDRYTAWQDNVRAIALALEALRKVDRYGVTRHGEQYRGWKALPSAGGTTWTAEAAARYLVQLVGPDQPALSEQLVLGDAGEAKAAIRFARRRTHPDHGGSHDAFTAVGAAATVLEQHHGRRL